MSKSQCQIKSKWLNFKTTFLLSSEFWLLTSVFCLLLWYCALCLPLESECYSTLAPCPLGCVAMNYRYSLYALVITLLIIYVSSMPGSARLSFGTLNEQIISNLAHIPAFAFLTFLWVKTFENNERLNFFWINSLVITGLILFSISDEIHQSFVPGRTASIWDVGLDLIGIFLGFFIFSVCNKYALSQEK